MATLAYAAQNFIDKQQPYVDEAYQNSKDWVGFLDALAEMESQSNYGALNPLGYAGMYQFGSGLLSTMHFYTTGIGAQLLGVTNRAQYLENPIAQELSALIEFSGLLDKNTSFSNVYNKFVSKFTSSANGYTQNNLNQLLNHTFTINYIDATTNKVAFTQTVDFTPAAISAAAHLGGVGAAADFAAHVWNACFDATTNVQTSSTANLPFTTSSYINSNGKTITQSFYYPNGYPFTDGSNIPVSDYMALLQKFNVDALVNSNGTLASFNSLAQTLISYDSDYITSYLTKKMLGLSLTVSGTYKDTVASIVQGLGVTLPSGMLNNFLSQASGKVIIPADYFASVFSSAVVVDHVSDDNGDLIIGGSASQETLEGSATGNNALIAGGGSDTLLTGSGNDTLVSGSGQDLLEGGGGTNTYDILSHVNVNGQSQSVSNAAVTIKDDGGKGVIEIDGTPLTTSGTVIPFIYTMTLPGQLPKYYWSDLQSGVTYRYDPDPNKEGFGNLTITFAAGNSWNLPAGKTIVLQDASLGQLEFGNYLGIHLANDATLYYGASLPSFSAQPSNVEQKVGASAVLTLSTANGKTAELSCSGPYLCEMGAETFDFSKGPVTLTIPPGQNSITFTLIDTSGSSTPDVANLTATVTDSGGNTISANNLAVTFDQPGFGTGTGSVTPDHTINGDLNPLLDANGSYQYDSLGNIITDGTASPNFNDTLYGSQAGNDLINTGGGTNIVHAGEGNNTINGGSGNDEIHAGNGANVISGNGGQDTIAVGNGANVITGNGGRDIITAGSGDNQIYAGDKIGFATALAQQTDPTIKASGLQGDLIAVGDGNNTIMGGTGNDVIFTGTGNNTIVCGPGQVTLAGGVEVTQVVSPWSTSTGAGGTQFFGVGLQASSVTSGLPSPYFGTVYTDAYGVQPALAGDDTIFGGTGNSTYILSNGDNWLDAGGGNDFIQAGIGSNTIFGGTGNDTIYGGGGNSYINLESGNDYVVAAGGDNTIVGGSGDDTIYSGTPSGWMTPDSHSNNYIYGGSGNTKIYGSAGNDTLISGSEAGTGKATEIHAGNGNEYVVGGGGDDTIYGGSGNNTIYAGDGNASITGSSSTSESSSIYGGMGSDTIYGGNGTDAINAGDGGTAAQATEVHAGNGTTTLYGGAGVDKLYGSTVSGAHDTLIAGTGTSTLQGGAGTEVMYSSIGNATLIAGSGSDTLYGGGGTDVLQGGSGRALLVAGSGTETIVGGSGANTFEFDQGFGYVTVQNAGAADTFKFGSGISAGDLMLTAATGSDGNPALIIQYGNGQITLDGGLNLSTATFKFADGSVASVGDLMADAYLVDSTVTDANGNSTVFGSSDGNSILTGGAGNTTFVINNSTDVIQAQSTGTNTVLAGASYVTPVNVQNLTGIGTADISLAGNDVASATITANSGNDTLVAGAAVDTLIGGTGNDTFVVNNSADVVQAQDAGSNVNTVQSSVDFSLATNGSGVQNLIGTGTADLTLTGNNLNDVIVANSGNDTLIGGAGDDTLIGGSGLDTFMLGRNMGADLVMDSSSQGAVLQLGAGVAASDLLYAQQGNDLLVGVSGSASTVRIKGYFLDQTKWSIDAGGISQPLQIAPTQIADQQAQVAALEENYFIAKTEADITSSYLSQGYVQQADGTLATSYSTARSIWGIGLDSTGTTQESTTIQYQPSSGTPLEVSTDPNYTNWYWTGAGWVYESSVTGYCDNSKLNFGSWSGSLPQGVANGDPITLTATSPQNQVIYDAGPTTPTSYSSTSSWSIPNVFALRNVVSFNSVTTDATAPVIVGDYSVSPTYTYSYQGAAWLPVSWTNTYNRQYTSDSASLSYGLSGTSGAYYVDSVQATQNTQTTSTSYYTGVGAGPLMSDPGTLLTPQELGNSGDVLPQVIPVTLTQNQFSYEMQTINVGAGDHTVIGYDHTIVNAGTGNNTIYGAGMVYTGSGNDVVSSSGGVVYGGSGNSTIAGASTVYSGTGNDSIYYTSTVYGGYGNDHIYFASEVHSGAGNDYVVAAKTVYGGSGNDTIGGAGTVYGGAGNDLVSWADTVYAGSGNDLLMNDLTDIVGTGNDTILGGGRGTTNVVINPTTVGNDLIGGDADNGIAVLNAYYTSQGVADWLWNYKMAGTYSLAYWKNYFDANVVNNRTGEQWFSYSASNMAISPATAASYAQQFYGMTLQQAVDQGLIVYTEPLTNLAVAQGSFLQPSSYYASAGTPIAQTFKANDFAAMEPYYEGGLLPPTETVTFGAGLSLTDLHLSWGQVTTSLSPGLKQPSKYTTLDITWGTNQSVQVIIPHSDDPVGYSVSDFAFANGTKVSMADLIAMAPPAPTFDPQLSNFVFDPTMGNQTLPNGVTSIQFAAGIDPTQVTVTQDASGNFVVSYNGGAATLTIPAADAISSPVTAAFANNTSWQFVNANGGTYTYNAGSGVVYLINATGTGTVQFGSGITSSMITLGIGSLMIRVGNGGDVLHIEGFNPQDALNSGEIQNFKFADGTTLTYAQLLARGFDIYGTTGNETLTGTNLDNRIYAGTGDDVMIGSGAHDTLYGGVGNETMIGGAGDELMIAGSGLTTMMGGTGTNTFVINNTADVVQAQAGATNTIETSVSYTASANVQTLTGTGTADIVLTGNDIANTITANSGNDTLVAGSGVATMVGGAGNDTFVVNNVNDVVQAQAGGVNTIETSVSYTASANVQNLVGIGSADITLTGNDLANTITANSGNDTLVADSGVATMIGGAGSDTFVVNNVNDVVQAQSTGSNVNTIETSVSYTASANVQNLVGIGSADIILTGNDIANTITANSGNDTLVAGSGVATMVGGAGNDTFYVNNTGDVVQAESTGSNVNTVYTSVSYVAPANVENLIGTGSADITLTGNDIADTITANSGNDTLVAGTGVATMIGGTGNDDFYVNNVNDVVQAQSTGSNVNTVYTSVSYVAPANVENLIGIGSADIMLTGNDLADTIVANSGNDTLVAGTGLATMVGGVGNDDFYVNNSADMINAQLTGSNVNTAYSSVDFSLATNGQNVQNLVGTGTANLTLTGNSLDNTITANSGNDTLVSLSGNDTLISGTGVDTMVGGTGNDDFYVNNSADLINAQLTGSNLNTAYASVSYDMATNAQNVQDLTGVGTADLILTGNSLDNVITANAGNDFINGGLGNDALIGGRGANVLEDTSGNNTLTDTQGQGVLYGGAGADTLTGGGGNSFFAAGAGNDVVAPGAFDSVVAFNAGDGADTIMTAAGGSNTLSLGGSISFNSLSLARNGNDLIFNVSAKDSITFHDWYASTANADFTTLQIIGPQKASTLGGDLTGYANEFDFSQIVSTFDKQTANKPPLSPWNMTAALVHAHLSSSDTAAMGGDLAYYYGSQGSLAGMNLAAAQTTLKDPAFGSQAQTLSTVSSVQGATVTL